MPGELGSTAGQLEGDQGRLAGSLAVTELFGGVNSSEMPPEECGVELQLVATHPCVEEGYRFSGVGPSPIVEKKFGKRDLGCAGSSACRGLLRQHPSVMANCFLGIASSCLDFAEAFPGGHCLEEVGSVVDRSMQQVDRVVVAPGIDEGEGLDPQILLTTRWRGPPETFLEVFASF